jgi:hypothetical protein
MAWYLVKPYIYFINISVAETVEIRFNFSLVSHFGIDRVESNKIMANQMGGICSTERDHSEVLGVGGKIILG